MPSRQTIRRSRSHNRLLFATMVVIAGFGSSTIQPTMAAVRQPILTDSQACVPVGPGNPTQDSSGNYYGGATIQLNASGLPPGAVSLFYSGPRQSNNGGSEVPSKQYSYLGKNTVGKNGNLGVSITLPEDAATATGDVLAFQTTAAESGSSWLSNPVQDWSIPVVPHPPVMTVEGNSGDEDTVANESTGEGCTVTIPSTGSSQVLLPGPGIYQVTPPITGPTPTTAPEIVAVVSGGVVMAQPLPPHYSNLSGCTNVRFKAYDQWSGNPMWWQQTGSGPFGYFLSRSNTPDPIAIIATGYSDPSTTEPLSTECLSTLSSLHITEVTPNPGGGTTTHNLSAPAAVPPTSASVQSFATTFGTRLCVMFAFPCPTPAAVFMAGAVPDSANSRVVLTSLGLTPLPVGTEGAGSLVISDGTNSQTLATINLIAPYWDGTSVLAPMGGGFNTATRIYTLTGKIPATAPNNLWSGPTVGFGWSGVPFLPNNSFSFSNGAGSYYPISEAFSTDGVWTVSGTNTNQLTLLGHQVLNVSYPLSPSYNNPYRPTSSFSHPNLFTWSKDGIVDQTVPLSAINFDHIHLGVNLHIKMDASAHADLSGAIQQHLQGFNVTITPAGELDTNVSVSLDAGVGGVGIGLLGVITLAVPIHYTQTGWSANYCLQGSLSWGLSYWYNLLFTSGSGWLYGPHTIVGPGTIAGTCPAMIRVFHHALSPASKLALRHKGYRVFTINGSADPSTLPMADANFDSQGRGTAVWVDSSGNQESLDAAPWTGSDWGAPTTLASSGVAMGSPRVVELGDGRAVAVWRAMSPLSDAEKQQLATDEHNQDLDDAITLLSSHVDIDYAIFDGSVWQSPQSLTNDTLPDGDGALVANTAAHTATLVWPHGAGDSDGNYSLDMATLSAGASSWSSPSPISGTNGLDTRSPALAIDSKGLLSLGFIAGAPGEGTVSVGGLAGSMFTASASQPAIPSGAENLRLSRDGTETVLSADVQPVANNAISTDEPSLYVDSTSGKAWRQTLLGAGDSPVMTSAGSNVFLAFHRPDGTQSADTSAQVDDVEISSKGVVTKAGLVTGVAGDSVPTAAAFDPTGNVQVLYGTTAPEGTDATDPAWNWAINPVSTQLGSSDVNAASVPLDDAAVADLAGAKISPAHPTPGETVTVTATLHNPGPVSTTASGSIQVLSVGAALHNGAGVRRQVFDDYPFNDVLKGNGSAKIQFSFPCPSSSFALGASGVGSTASPSFGAPLAPTGLTRGSTTTGDPILSWQESKKTPAAYFYLYRANSAGAPSLVGITTGNSIVDEGAGLATGVAYYVVAVDAYRRHSTASDLFPDPPN
jgi:hypothetical protein